MNAWLDDLVTRRGSMRAVGVMRAAFGFIVVRHLWPDLSADVTPVDRFHVVWWSWLPEPSATAYRGLVWLGILAGLAMIVGLACRVATATALVVVAYLLFVDMTGFAHNRGFLVWMLAGLAVLPTDRSFSLDRALRDRRPRPAATGSVDPPATPDGTGPLWPVYGLRVVVSTVYLTSGLTKLLDDDWRGGLVLWDRVNRFSHNIPFDGWIEDVVTSRPLMSLLSPSAIAVEVFIGLGLWSNRTRLAAIWVALAFHGSIEIAASVQTFSYSAIAALLLWVVPSTGDRTLVGGGPLLRAWVPRLDVLERFEVGEGPGPTVLHDRDGVVREGREAVLVVLSRLPACFPVAGPCLALLRARRRRVRTSASGRNCHTDLQSAPSRATTRTRHGSAAGQDPRGH